MLETLVPLGSQGDRPDRSRVAEAPIPVLDEGETARNEEKGRLSNPVRLAQRRLKPGEIDRLLAAHLAGDPIRDIAARFGVSRTTVIGHVTRSGLPRRSDQGWSEPELRAAAELYADGHSLAAVGEQFGADATTVANRFRRAGLPIRRRGGWV